MPTIRLARGGKKASRFTKFKFFVDGEPAGVLAKWGDRLEVEVSPGTHLLEVKSFGGARGAAEIEFQDADLDLQCGFPSVMGSQLKWMTGGDALAFWESET